MMVRPKHFGYDPASAASNAFQIEEGSENIGSIRKAALQEFDRAVDTLQNSGIEVIVIEDSDQPFKPNAVFPNNWISFHQHAKAILYPMMAENRRHERRPEVLDELIERGMSIDEVVDLSPYEDEGKFLEGTGSLVFDYPNALAYACISPRTHPDVLHKLAEITGFEPVIFEASGRNGIPLYHTNVMMCIAEAYALVCLDAIPGEQRTEVAMTLQNTGHEVIGISYDQLYAFAGNMLEVLDKDDRPVLVMSDTAMQSLTFEQEERLSPYARLLPVSIPTIEKYGGGSIRCMMCRVN